MIYMQLTQLFWIIFNYSKKVFWGPFSCAQVRVSANTHPLPVSYTAVACVATGNETPILPNPPYPSF